MLAELRDANQNLTGSLRSAHVLCEQHRDVGTASLIEARVNEAERRTWFLLESIS
jgi:starvation-inducible DNA-binding protein